MAQPIPSSLRKYYDCDLNPNTGETLQLWMRDSWPMQQGLLKTIYRLYSPLKGEILRVEISDPLNHNFRAW